MNKQIILALVFALIALPLYSNNSIIDEELNFAEDLKYPVMDNLADSDTVTERLKQNTLQLKLDKDTAGVIVSLHTIVRHYINNLDYVNAYDSELEALQLSEIRSDSVNMSKSYENLSEINVTFGQKTYAERYIRNAIDINKKLVINDEAPKKALIANYYYAAIIYRQFKDYDVALNYIDSCQYLDNIINQDTLNRRYYYSEKAILLIMKGNYSEGEKILLQVQDVFESLPIIEPENKTYIDYLVFVYSFLGYSFSQQNDIKRSKAYFYKSLKHMNRYSAHLGMKSYVLYELAVVLSREGNTSDAYKAMHASKLLYDNFYGINSGQNLRLIETKNAYEEEIEAKNEALLQNEILLTNKEKSLLKIRILLITLVSLIILGVLVVKNRNQRVRYKHERETLSRENELKEQAANHLLEVKNKELTTYTLQFIEKDKANQALLQLLKHNKDPKEVAPYMKTVQANQSLWDEFNHRFNSVNNGFYERLSARFPDLSTTDLKHCALIKLNFTGKEMAHLLGISLSSVHTSRYRIRKKMKLDRDANLGSFMSSI